MKGHGHETYEPDKRNDCVEPFRMNKGSDKFEPETKDQDTPYDVGNGLSPRFW
jgi:hypothetical protein